MENVTKLDIFRVRLLFLKIDLETIEKNVFRDSLRVHESRIHKIFTAEHCVKTALCSLADGSRTTLERWSYSESVWISFREI